MGIKFEHSAGVCTDYDCVYSGTRFCLCIFFKPFLSVGDFPRKGKWTPAPPFQNLTKLYVTAYMVISWRSSTAILWRFSWRRFKSRWCATVGPTASWAANPLRLSICRHEKRRRRADTVCGNFMRMRKFSTTCIEFYTYMCQIVDIYMTFYSEMLNIPSEH